MLGLHICIFGIKNVLEERKFALQVILSRRVCDCKVLVTRKKRLLSRGCLLCCQINTERQKPSDGEFPR
jgi:hypothetical protein